MEWFVLNRLEGHLENMKHFPHQLIGFCNNISMQDLFLVLQDTLLQPKAAQTQGLRAIDVTHSTYSNVFTSLNVAPTCTIAY